MEDLLPLQSEVTFDEKLVSKKGSGVVSEAVNLSYPLFHVSAHRLNTALLGPDGEILILFFSHGSAKEPVMRPLCCWCPIPLRVWS